MQQSENPQQPRPKRCEDLKGSGLVSKTINNICPEGYQPYKYGYSDDTRNCCAPKQIRARPTIRRPAQSFSKFSEDPSLVLAYNDQEIARLFPTFAENYTPQERLKMIRRVTEPIREWYTTYKRNPAFPTFTKQVWESEAKKVRQRARAFRARQLTPQPAPQPVRPPKRRNQQQQRQGPQGTPTKEAKRPRGYNPPQPQQRMSLPRRPQLPRPQQISATQPTIHTGQQQTDNFFIPEWQLQFNPEHHNMGAQQRQRARWLQQVMPQILRQNEQRNGSKQSKGPK